MKGSRKLLFFLIVLVVAAFKLEDGELATVLITLVTIFGGANAIEHHSAKKP